MKVWYSVENNETKEKSTQMKPGYFSSEIHATTRLEKYLRKESSVSQILYTKLI